MREALGKARQLAEIAERLGRFGDEMAELAADGAGALLRHQQPSGEARAFGVDCRLALGLARLGPAFGADQRHEGDGAVVFFLVFVIADAADEVERLMRAAADRNDEPSADGELLLQRLRHFRTAGRDQDGVERGLLRQALGAVGEDDLGIGVTETRDPLARLVGQHVVALDGEHLAGDAAQHRRRVARAGADLEHRVGGPKLQQLDHAGDDIRLRDGLPGLDGQRRILIGEIRQMLRHERLARHRAHGRKHQRIADAARRQMPRHHDGAVARMPVGASGELGGGGGHWQLNYWNGQSFGLDMNQQSYARCRASQNASSWPGLSRPSTTSCQGRLDRSATGLKLS